MSRSGKITRRVIEPDPLYHSCLVTRFTNRMMLDGKKVVAQKLIYQALDNIEKNAHKNPLTVFETAINNVMPKVEVKPRRIGGASYQIPTEVRGDRREALAIRWLINAARSRSNKEYHSFADKLSAELLDAADNKGMAIKKKEDTQKAAEANRAFAHFKW